MQETPKIEKGLNSGSKYLRTIRNTEGVKLTGVDVYAVIEAFNVTNAGAQHAIKKLLCAGIRGKGSTDNDLLECIPAINRAVQIEKDRAGVKKEEIENRIEKQVNALKSPIWL